MISKHYLRNKMTLSSFQLIVFQCYFFTHKLYCKNILDIDSAHLEIEKKCGNIPKTASSRIVNAKESSRHYPWVVRVARINDNFKDNMHMYFYITTWVVKLFECENTSIGHNALHIY